MGKGDGGREAATGLSPQMWAREAAGTIVEPGVTRFFTGNLLAVKNASIKSYFFTILFRRFLGKCGRRRRLQVSCQFFS